MTGPSDNLPCRCDLGWREMPLRFQTAFVALFFAAFLTMGAGAFLTFKVWEWAL